MSALPLLTDEPAGITWERLVDAEPILEQLRQMVARDDNREWAAYQDFKQAMSALVGWHAEDDGLPDWMLTPMAYDVAHATILRPHF